MPGTHPRNCEAMLRSLRCGAKTQGAEAAEHQLLVERSAVACMAEPEVLAHL